MEASRGEWCGHTETDASSHRVELHLVFWFWMKHRRDCGVSWPLQPEARIPASSCLPSPLWMRSLILGTLGCISGTKKGILWLLFCSGELFRFRPKGQLFYIISWCMLRIGCFHCRLLGILLHKWEGNLPLAVAERSLLFFSQVANRTLLNFPAIKLNHTVQFAHRAFKENKNPYEKACISFGIICCAENLLKVLGIHNVCILFLLRMKPALIMFSCMWLW